MMCRPEPFYFLKLSKVHSRLLRYRHHSLNLKFSLQNSVVPLGLRLKKTPCVASYNREFAENWQYILRQAEESLVSLLKSEVDDVLNHLEDQLSHQLIDLSTKFGADVCKETFEEVRERQQELESTLRKRRDSKWCKLLPELAREQQPCRRPTLSSVAVSRIQAELLEAQNFNSLLEPFHRPDFYTEFFLETVDVNIPPQPSSDNNNHSYTLSTVEQPDILHNDVSTEQLEVSEEPDEQAVILNVSNNSHGNILKPSDNVFNLSSRVLSPSEISVLSKGLNFCPTPKSINRFQLKKDLIEFGRRLKCKYFFHKPNSEVSTVPEDGRQKFRKKSSWSPIISEPALCLYLSELEARLLSVDERGHNYDNVPYSEKEALKTLKNCTDIVIKQADKGSAVVVLDLSDYCEEAFRQLYDVSVYDCISCDPTMDVASLVNDKIVLLKDSGYIDGKCAEYLKVENPRLGKFYLLPKIHKSLIKGEVPGRPIISNCGMPTENISEFLDFHLQPLVREIPSYIKDTSHFLCKLNEIGSLPDNSIIVTIDVVGLYSHIPHSEGLLALSKALDLRNTIVIPSLELVELAAIVLQNNYFGFDDKIFHQKLGTAMGTKFAPAFANIFMGDLENKLLDSISLKPWLWWRYLDDIFCVWTHGCELLAEFLECLNNFHPTIKFTSSVSYTSLPFLDVLVSINNGSFSTDLYCKSTDTHQYLDSKSCHPYHIKKAIPFSQALRLKRICSDQDNFERRAGEMKSWFRKRGYKDELLDRQIFRAKQRSREEALRPKHHRNGNNAIPLVLDFHPALSKVPSILEGLQPILSSCSATREIFPDKPFVSFRRPRNLKDSLVRAKLPSRRVDLDCTGMHACGKTRCQICRFVSGGRVFSDSTSQNKFYINYRFDCDSVGVIYLLSCKRCAKQYVGSTITTFRKRFNNHKSSFNRFGKGQRGIPGEHLYAHFFSHDHEGLADLKVMIIDKTNVTNPTEREGFWTYKLKTLSPMGLNICDFF